MKSIYCRRSVSLLFALFALLLFAAPPRVRAEGRATTYNNAGQAYITASCDSGGNLEIYIYYEKKPGVTASARIETYIEKRGFLGIFWSRVDIEPANDCWVDQTSASSFNTTHYHTFVTTGTYRVKTMFKVSGSGGSDDTIERTETVVY